MKNKTLATWLTFFGGPLGLHRFYLRGLGDLWGWLLPLPRPWVCMASTGSCNTGRTTR